MGGKRGDNTIFTTPMPEGSAGMMMGASGLAVTLDAAKIRIRKEKVAAEEPSTTTAFKLVLLKIA